MTKREIRLKLLRICGLDDDSSMGWRELIASVELEVDAEWEQRLVAEEKLDEIRAVLDKRKPFKLRA